MHSFDIRWQISVQINIHDIFSFSIWLGHFWYNNSVRIDRKEPLNSAPTSTFWIIHKNHSSVTPLYKSTMAESEAQYYDEDEDEEMPLTERDLADDAQWKLIQKNTFSRWANEHLKTVNKSIANLDTDLTDGLRLVALIEVLSGKKFKHVNRRPNFRTQKLENVTRVLEFLERDEGIRIVNIGKTYFVWFVLICR